MLRFLLFLVGVMAGAAAALIYAGLVTVPPSWTPWGPLDLTEEPGAFTRIQLAGLKEEPGACFAALERAGVGAVPQPRRPVENGCGLVDTARVGQVAAAYSSGFVATCPLIAALYLFERHVLDPAARLHLDSGVARVNHVGTYNCRNVYGRTVGRRSEHATANAIDIRGFVLDDGRIVSLARHWGDARSAEGAFLREVNDGACRFFNAVLGPDYNAAHRDHFHLDMGRWRVCR
ncbi:extensin family protein [Skermanella mucosa]|uniref:extensin-like domain-containing protein n=1 Tax=Skermanella mucosa TaxID=1789672 RepID=UPI00192B33BD|nr:extensin family protein [Skermanella mucosa]UEM21424.1 extensin family protein [Skermanella mucosa]